MQSHGRTHHPTHLRHWDPANLAITLLITLLFLIFLFIFLFLTATPATGRSQVLPAAPPGASLSSQA